eukprot:gene9155-10107_t
MTSTAPDATVQALLALFTNIFPSHDPSSCTDSHLKELLIATGSAALSDFLHAPVLSTITSDVDLVKQAIEKFDRLALYNDSVSLVSPYQLILQGLPEAASEESILNMFRGLTLHSGNPCPLPATIRFDSANRVWYLTYNTPDELRQANGVGKRQELHGVDLKRHMRMEGVNGSSRFHNGRVGGDGYGGFYQQGGYYYPPYAGNFPGQQMYFGYYPQTTNMRPLYPVEMPQAAPVPFVATIPPVAMPAPYYPYGMDFVSQGAFNYVYPGVPYNNNNNARTGGRFNRGSPTYGGSGRGGYYGNGQQRRYPRNGGNAASMSSRSGEYGSQEEGVPTIAQEDVAVEHDVLPEDAHTTPQPETHIEAVVETEFVAASTVQKGGEDSAVIVEATLSESLLPSPENDNSAETKGERRGVPRQSNVYGRGEGEDKKRRPRSSQTGPGGQTAGGRGIQQRRERGEGREGRGRPRHNETGEKREKERVPRVPAVKLDLETDFPVLGETNKPSSPGARPVPNYAYALKAAPSEVRPAPVTSTVSSPPPQEVVSSAPPVVAPTAVPEEVPSYTVQETRVPLVAATTTLEESFQNITLDSSSSKKSFIDVLKAKK